MGLLGRTVTPLAMRMDVGCYAPANQASGHGVERTARAAPGRLDTQVE